MAETVKTITIKINGQDALVDINEIKKALKETRDNAKKIEDTNLTNFNSQISDLKDKFKAGEIGAGGLAKGILGIGKALFAAFIGNPVLLAIGAITTAIVALYGLFKNFTPLVDKVQQAFAGVTAVFTTLKSSAIGLITGNKSLSETFNGLGKSMSDAAKEAYKLEQAQQDLEDQAKDLELANSKSQTKIDELILASKNRTISEQERMDLIDKAMKLEEEQFQANKKYADEAERIAFNKMIVGKRFSEEEIEWIKEVGIAKARAFLEDKDVSEADIEIWRQSLLKQEEIARQFIVNEEKRFNAKDALAQKQEDKAKAAAEKQKEIDAKRLENEKKLQQLEKDKEISSIERDKKRNEFLNERTALNIAYYAEEIKRLDENYKIIEQKERKAAEKYELGTQERNDADKKRLETEKKYLSERYFLINQSNLQEVNAADNRLILLENSHDAEKKLYEKKISDLDNNLAKLSKSDEDYETKKTDLEVERGKSIIELQNLENNYAINRLKALDDITLATVEYQKKQDQLNEEEIQKNREATLKKFDLWASEREFLINNNDINSKLHKEKIAAIDELVAGLTKAYNDDIISEQEYNDRKRDLANQRKSMIDAEFKFRLQTAADTIQKISQIDQEATQTAINLQAQKLKNGVITQEAYDKKVAEIQKNAAKREKAYAVSAVIISTIQAVSNALATKLPWPIPAALAVVAGALGAVQIAKIISTPISSSAGSSSAGSGTVPSVPDTSSSTGTAPNTSFSFSQTPQQVSANEPIKTYVLTKDVSTQSQLDRQVRANGTI